MLVTPPRRRRRRSREAGFVTVVVFFTFLRALFAITLAIAFPRSSAQPLEPRQLSLCEHAAPPGSKLPTSPSTRTAQPVIIIPLSAQYRCFHLHSREVALSSIAVLSQDTPKCLLVTARVAFGPPPTFSLLAHCGGIVGVSF